MSSFANSTAWLTGYIPDLPTPLDEFGKLDLVAFSKLCERQMEAGVSALVAGETAGEAPTLALSEYDTIVRTAVETARGRVRVIAGALSNSTSHAIELSRRAELAGADAVLSVVPYYNKPMQAGIAAHFQAIAASTALPIILHDIPSRTIRELSDGTLCELAQSPRFIGLRDASGDPSRPLRLRATVPLGFRLLSGDDTNAVAFLANGGDGCISTVSNVAPDLCQAIYSSCRQGRLQSALDLQHRLAPLAALLAKENPAALKYALCLLGFMRAEPRLPLVGLADPTKAEVANAIAEIGEDLARNSWVRTGCKKSAQI